MRFLYSCYSLLLALSGYAYGQYDKLLNKTYPQRYDNLREIYVKAMGDPDSVSAFREANTLHKLAIEHGDSDLELETGLLKAYYMTYWHRNETGVIEKAIRALTERAAAEDNLQIGARAHKVLGDYYWFTLKNYELGFETYMLLEQLLEKVSLNELPDKVYHLQNMAQAYHNFSDYRKALYLFSQIQELEDDNDPRGGRNSALYSIGKIYRQLGKLDSSDYYYRKIIDNENSVNHITWKGIASGGLGQNHFLRGAYEKAVPYLQADVDQALVEKDFGLAAGSLITLADISLKQNNLSKAEQQALLARKCLSMAASDRYKHYQDLYPVLSKLYAAKGMPQLAGPYLDSAIFAKDSVTREFSAMRIMRAKQKIELQEHRLAIEKADAEKVSKTRERNLLMVIVFLLIAGSGYFFYMLRRRHLLQQRHKELEIKDREQQLVHATRQLEEFAKNISEKSQLIQHLEAKGVKGVDFELLDKLRESTILTQDDWEYFKKLFEKVHSGYLQRLKQKFPDLTQAEIRFVVLVKLGLDYQAMSSTLGVSGQAVRTTKYRLLKKIELPGDSTFEEVIADI
jgi:DNA-binding CsgD family transcriptional regulator